MQLDYCYLMPLLPAPLLDKLKKSVISKVSEGSISLNGQCVSEANPE